MPTPDAVLLKRLLATFKVEAREHIEAIASGLVGLESAPSPETKKSIFDATFRSAHSLKGAARAVNAAEIETLCHALESVFSALKRQELSPSPELFDLLHRTVDALGQLAEFIDSASSSSARPRVAELSESLRALLAGDHPAPPLPAVPEVAAGSSALTSPEKRREPVGTVRVSTAKLDAVLLQAEEMLSAKQAASHHAAMLGRISRAPYEWRRKWAKLRPDVRLVQRTIETGDEGNGRSAASPHLARIVEFLEWSGDFVETLDRELVELAGTSLRDERAVGAMVDNLLDEMKKVVMQPFSTLLDVFPRFVRELSRDQGKEVELVIEGGEIEIDRRILEEMKDPLIHLVRNCLDHGIELPAERVRRGKSSRGKISLGISSRHGNNVELLIKDDGGGIDAGRVKSAALKLRLLSPEKLDLLSEREALSLIFQSGLSTSPMVTDISGLGLGLAIVKEKVEKLSGTLAVETNGAEGTSFRINLPLTLTRFHGVVVRVGEQLFVVPNSHVERVMRVRRAEVQTIENRETIVIGEQAVSLAQLHEVLEVAAKPVAPDILPILVLTSVSQRVAFAVDEILYEQEVMVKTLGRHLVRVRNIAGATVLETGRVVPILNVPDLIQSAIRQSGTGIHAAAPLAVVATGKKSVLVAEDSITSRTLLKNILESAGYQVVTAVDGIEAFAKLRSGEFDLVVSDVDMPRLNGFGLTAKIRADKKFSELPVILVTALDSREDREHGIDVGATAYIVKGSFDQSNLLDVIRRSI